MYKIISKYSLALLFALAAPAAFAQAGAASRAPDQLLKAVTAEVLAILKHEKDSQAGVPVKIAEVVETKILPLFDFTRMTRLAVALNWRTATPEQQQLLTAEFRTLLVRTYSTALFNYREQIIDFKPLRSSPGATEVTVKSVVKQPGADALTMDYDMEKVADGWMVYDIKVDGISLITTYRETFASKVRDGGVDGLIKALADKNRQGDARARVHHTDNAQFPAMVRLLLQSGA
jgi:phospholipid transport system substrate-binding protein